MHKQTTSLSSELENSTSAGNSSGVAPRGRVGGERKLSSLPVSFRYGPILAIILYGCNLGKYLNVLGNAINVATQSHCDTYSAEMVSKEIMGCTNQDCEHTYTTM